MNIVNFVSDDKKPCETEVPKNSDNTASQSEPSGKLEAQHKAQYSLDKQEVQNILNQELQQNSNRQEVQPNAMQKLKPGGSTNTNKQNVDSNIGSEDNKACDTEKHEETKIESSANVQGYVPGAHGKPWTSHWTEAKRFPHPGCGKGIPLSFLKNRNKTDGNFSIRPQNVTPAVSGPKASLVAAQKNILEALQFAQIPTNNPSQKMTVNIQATAVSTPKLKVAVQNRQLTTLVGQQETKVDKNEPIFPTIQPNVVHQPNFVPIQQMNQPSFTLHNINRPNFGQGQPNFVPNQPVFQPNQPIYMQNQPTFVLNQPTFVPNQPAFVPNQPMFEPNQPLFEPNQTQEFAPNHPNTSTFGDQHSSNQSLTVQTDTQSVEREATPEKQMYSPTDAYLDGSHEDTKQEEESRDGSESPDFLTTGQKRLSAFKRLGPVAEAKKPKLTINLTLNKEDSVRQVVDDTKQPSPEEEYVPFHLRPEVTSSTDETVMKYLVYWPWKKTFKLRKAVTFRRSRTVMMMELEQMEETYQKDTTYLQVSIFIEIQCDEAEGKYSEVTDYPKSWNKEQVLDALLEALKGKSFIPCFIYFSPEICKFLVIRSAPALCAIHKMNFKVHSQNVDLNLSISDINLNSIHLDFLPRLILSKRMAKGYDGERKLCLREFTLQEEVSHFIYFPLHRYTNQADLVRIQSIIAWDYITDLDLSRNKLRTIDGFDLPLTCPRLKNLDLSHNYLEKITTLLKIRELPLKTLKLEGNPLCLDYIDPQHYVKVMRMMFNGLIEIDGVPIQRKGDFPEFVRNYCPEECSGIVTRFLEVFFPLMDSPFEDRPLMENLYHEDAVLTITYQYKLRYCSVFRYFRNIFLRSRILDERELDSIKGASNICKHYSRWPAMKHDPYTFTVDVLFHNETSLILRVNGILKLTAETLAEDEEILSFTRTFVLRAFDDDEYKIYNEMVYWENATEDCANNAFKITTLKSKRLSLKLDSAPDEDLKENMTALFMQITNLEKKPSERCLELKDWNFKSALQLFQKLLQVDNLNYLFEEVKEN